MPRWSWRCSGTTGIRKRMFCYTNNIPHADGGTHLAGFRAALTRTLNAYIEREARPQGKSGHHGDDAREASRRCSRSSCRIPKFSSQTKDKLVSSEVKGAVESAVGTKLEEFLLEHPAEAKSVVGQDHRSGPGQRSGPQGAGDDPSQGRAGCRGSARQLADCQERIRPGRSCSWWR